MTIPPRCSDPEALLSDPESFARTTQSLRRVALSIVGDHAASEDVVQGAWLEVLQRQEAGIGLGWLRKLVRRRAIDVLRRRARRPTQRLESEVQAPGAGPDSLNTEIDLQRAVLDAVDSLAEPYRSTIYLRYFKGLGPTEIAQRSGVPKRTVETQLLRGNALLRERLRPSLGAENGKWSPGLVAFAGAPPSVVPSSLAPLASVLVMKNSAIGLVVVSVLFLGWFTLAGSRGESIDHSVTSAASERSETDGSALALTLEPTSMGGTTREAIDADEFAGEIAPPPPARHGSLRVAVVYPGGVAAPGVFVIATKEADSYLLRRRFRRRTDEAGIAYFPALSPASFEIRTDRSDGVQEAGVEVLVGETSEAAVVLPVGLRVVGQVRDTRGRPVANAGIWLTSPTGGWTGGAIVARSDAAGNFELRGVPAGQSLGALAKGCLPSLLVDLDRRERDVSPTTVELVVQAGGARLAGTIRDCDGKALEDIVVALGDYSGDLDMRTDGTIAEDWGPRSLRTDAEGRFEFDALVPGTFKLRTRRHRFPQWSGEVELTAGDVTTQDIVLAAGATLTGRVTDTEGRAVAGAMVHAFQEPLEEEYLQSGQVDFEGPFTGATSRADVNGEYRLENVAPREVFLYAREAPSGRRRLGRVYPYTRQRRILASSATVEWNPVIADGLIIEGVAEYRDGRPLANLFIILTAEGGDGRALHSPDGSFKFIQLKDEPHTVRVQMWARPEGAEDPMLTDIRPGLGAIRVVAEFDSPIEVESAKACIKFADTAKRAVGSPRVILESLDKYSWRYSENEGQEGLWKFELGEIGRYRPIAVDGERVIAMGEEFVIQGGEELDLGLLESEEGGTLVLNCVRSSDAPPGKVSVYLNPNGCRHGEHIELGPRSELRVEGVEPGPGTISVAGDSVMKLQFNYVLLAGEEKVLDLELISAAAVPYKIAWEDAPPGESMHARFVDRQTGGVVGDFQTDQLHLYKSPMEFSIRLPIGSYTLEVDFGSMPDLKAEFEVTSLESKGARVVEPL